MPRKLRVVGTQGEGKRTLCGRASQAGLSFTHGCVWSPSCAVICPFALPPPLPPAALLPGPPWLPHHLSASCAPSPATSPLPRVISQYPGRAQGRRAFQLAAGQVAPATGAWAQSAAPQVRSSGRGRLPPPHTCPHLWGPPRLCAPLPGRALGKVPVQRRVFETLSD